MSKPIFIMTVGIPGSGKSTWASELENVVVISSDDIRKELFGADDKECNGEENAKVFSVASHRVKKYLKRGRNVVLDATNLNKKRRIVFLKDLKEQGIDCYKQCELFMTSYEICMEQNKKRERVVPDKDMYKLLSGFQPPHKSEGWDAIEVRYRADYSEYNLVTLLNRCKGFDQENEHHALDLASHLFATEAYVSERTSDPIVRMAALLHDIGKLKTKVVDEEGEAHYYQHHCVGAYDTLLCMGSIVYDAYKNKGVQLIGEDKGLDVANLVYYHMHPYMGWSQSEKAKRKDRELLGEEMFNQLMLLHEADVEAHNATE